MNRAGSVLVTPSGTVEADCVMHLLGAAGISTTTAFDESDTVAAVALDLSGQPLEFTVAQLSMRAPGVPTVLIAAVVDEKVTTLAASSAAVAVVSWRARERALVEAVQQTLDGTARLSVGSSDGTAEPLGCLTTREQHILSHVAEGRRNEEIASALGISRHTVRTHVHRIMTKLDVPHRHALAAVARRTGRAARLDSRPVPVAPVAQGA